MSYQNEAEMYTDVRAWLTRFLAERNRGARINVFDSSRRSLARLINETGFFQNLRPEWKSWDVHVDVVGFVRTDTDTQIALVECKLTPLTLSHLSQTIGYSRIVLPELSILISPEGSSSSLQSLLVTYGRTDVLRYSVRDGQVAHSVAVARWNQAGQTIDRGTLITGNNAWR